MSWAHIYHNVLSFFCHPSKFEFWVFFTSVLHYFLFKKGQYQIESLCDRSLYKVCSDVLDMNIPSFSNCVHVIGTRGAAVWLTCNWNFVKSLSVSLVWREMLIPTFILPYSFYFMAVAFILPAALNGARFLTSVHADPLDQPLGVFPITLLTAGFRLLLPDAANSHKVLNCICVTDSGIYSYTPAIVHINAHIADILWEIFYGTVCLRMEKQAFQEAWTVWMDSFLLFPFLIKSTSW